MPRLPYQTSQSSEQSGCCWRIPSNSRRMRLWRATWRCPRKESHLNIGKDRLVWVRMSGAVAPGGGNGSKKQ